MAKSWAILSVPPSPGPMCASQRVFLCLEALAVALLRHFEARGCRQGAIWSVDNARQKETPAEGRGSKTSPGSVTLFPPREAFFLTLSLSLPNWHCDSRWWTACPLSSASFLSPGISMTPPVAGFVLLPATNGASADNGASPKFQTGRSARKSKANHPSQAHHLCGQVSAEFITLLTFTALLQ